MLSWHVVGVGDLLSGLRCAVVRRSVRTAGTDWALTFEFSTLNVGGCRSLPFSGRGPGCPLYLRNGRSSVSRPDGDHLSPRRSASGSSRRLRAAAYDPHRSSTRLNSLPVSRQSDPRYPNRCPAGQLFELQIVFKSHIAGGLGTALHWCRHAGPFPRSGRGAARPTGRNGPYARAELGDIAARGPGGQHHVTRRVQHQIGRTSSNAASGTKGLGVASRSHAARYTQHG